VVVVDNSSTDGTVEMIKKSFPQTNLIASQTNLGFAGGNNKILKQAKEGHFVLLNPDTEILPDTIEQLKSFIKKNPEYGLVGGKHINPDKSYQPSVRRFPTGKILLMLMYKIHRLIPFLPSLKKYFAKDLKINNVQKVEQLAGSYLVVNSKTIKKIGALDENFKIWFEDVDYCKRSHDAGLNNYYVPKTKIIHHGGQSFGQILNVKRQKKLNESIFYYAQKHLRFTDEKRLRSASLESILLARVAQILSWPFILKRQIFKN
tara:strand:- start:188 stop:970 length:783 start_codon:yes stop_codon:yes gene_type:complete